MFNAGSNFADIQSGVNLPTPSDEGVDQFIEYVVDPFIEAQSHFNKVGYNEVVRKRAFDVLMEAIANRVKHTRKKKANLYRRAKREIKQIVVKPMFTHSEIIGPMDFYTVVHQIIGLGYFYDKCSKYIEPRDDRTKACLEFSLIRDYSLFQNREYVKEHFWNEYKTMLVFLSFLRWSRLFNRDTHVSYFDHLNSMFPDNEIVLSIDNDRKNLFSQYWISPSLTFNLDHASLVKTRKIHKMNTKL